MTEKEKDQFIKQLQGEAKHWHRAYNAPKKSKPGSHQGKPKTERRIRKMQIQVTQTDCIKITNKVKQGGGK